MELAIVSKDTSTKFAAYCKRWISVVVMPVWADKVLRSSAVFAASRENFTRAVTAAAAPTARDFMDLSSFLFASSSPIVSL